MQINLNESVSFQIESYESNEISPYVLWHKKTSHISQEMMKGLNFIILTSYLLKDEIPNYGLNEIPNFKWNS